MVVVEPEAAQRDPARGATFGVAHVAAPDAVRSRGRLVVWAVKPQSFREAAAAACGRHVAGALQLSVMAGIRSDAIIAATGSERVVRAMPNTPALIGQGIAGLFARAAVTDERPHRGRRAARADRRSWSGSARKQQLDAVTALSGSGPAYVFCFVEALHGPRRDGPGASRGATLALADVAGSAALAAASTDHRPSCAARHLAGRHDAIRRRRRRARRTTRAARADGDEFGRPAGPGAMRAAKAAGGSASPRAPFAPRSRPAAPSSPIRR